MDRGERGVMGQLPERHSFFRTLFCLRPSSVFEFLGNMTS